MEETELAVRYYEAALEHAVQRTQFRDMVLLVYFTAMSAVFGTALSTTKIDPAVLMVIPFLSLGCSILVSYHNLILGQLVEYTKFLLNEYLTVGESKLVAFETSRYFDTGVVPAARIRTIGYVILIILPSLLALLFNLALLAQGVLLSLLWLGGGAALLISILTILFIDIRHHSAIMPKT